jgi:anti-sigma regulatory factor (Ser/Thr protein kinase)
MSAGRKRLTMPPDPGCLAELRLWARAWMERHPTDGVDPDSVLLSMTELVTNSIKHGSGPVDVRLSAETDNLVLNVSDCSEKMPLHLDRSQTIETGRGIQIMESLATRWGAQPEPGGGKTVWCEFASR